MSEALALLVTPRPIEEYHEDMGDVLWWCWEKIPAAEGVPGTEGRGRWLGEPPYVGSPLDLGQEVLIETCTYSLVNGTTEQVRPYQGTSAQRVNIGGWPGYHTHFTPLPPFPTPPVKP